MMDDFSLRSNLEEEATTLSLDEIREHIQNLRDQMMTGLPADRLSHAQINDLLNNLPRLTEQELSDLGHKDSSCPICITPYLAIIAEEEIAFAMDSPAHPAEELGITRLSQPWQCGHIFCRKDISKWIVEAHNSCPMCRRLLVQPTPGTAPADPIPDEQLALSINLLRFLDASNISPREVDEENRSQFSGMYS